MVAQAIEQLDANSTPCDAFWARYKTRIEEAQWWGRAALAVGIATAAALLVAKDLPSATNQITRDHIAAFLADLREKGQKSSTRHLRFSALSVFFNWAVKNATDTGVERSPLFGCRHRAFASIPCASVRRTRSRRCCGSAAAMG